ncbi:MAG: DUF3237 domain-containing protein [Sphingomonas sp.]
MPPSIDNAPALGPVRTRHLFDARLSASPPLVVGAVPAGDRRAVFVNGGAFRGERMQGSVGQGVDWQTGRANGSLHIDVRLVLNLDQGGVIAMRYVGLRAGPPKVMEDLARGTEVDPSAYYFRVEASFETSVAGYLWMNDILAVGIGHRFPSGPLYSFYELL